jgi:small conductance mechanosensitive channel
VGDTSGTVEDVTLRVTRLRSDDGTVWYVPNGEIRKLANSSRGWAQATVDVPVPIAARVDAVLEAIQAAADAESGDPRYAAMCIEPPRLWGVVATAADTFTCRVSVRTSTPDRERVARILRQEIALRLQAAGAFAVTAAAPPAPEPGGAALSSEPDDS